MNRLLLTACILLSVLLGCRSEQPPKVPNPPVQFVTIKLYTKQIFNNPIVRVHTNTYDYTSLAVQDTDGYWVIVPKGADVNTLLIEEQ